MTRTIRIFASITLFGILCAITFSVQAGTYIFKADGGGVHQSESDLSDSGGSFAVDRWFVSAGVDYAWDLRTSLGFSVGGGQSSYEFGDLAGLGGGEPWNKIKDARMSVTWRFGFGDTGSFIIIRRHVSMAKAARVPVTAALMAYMPPRPGGLMRT